MSHTDVVYVTPYCCCIANVVADTGMISSCQVCNFVRASICASCNSEGHCVELARVKLFSVHWSCAELVYL